MPRPATAANARHRRDLVALAAACNVQTVYDSSLTGETHASDESLLHVLRAWGVDLDTPEDARDALEEMHAQRARRRVEPVAVVWTTATPTIDLRLPLTRSGEPKTTGSARAQITTEDGDRLTTSTRVADLTPRARRLPGGGRAWTVALPLTTGEKLPAGYHRLIVEHAGETFESLVVCAPKVSYQLPQRRLGVFAPTYALRSRTNLGIGNLTDLRRFGAWAFDHGARVVSTLPLLSCFMEDTELFTRSPYSPVSRLFFNEIFLDPHAAPELASCPRAQRLLTNPSVVKRARALRARKDKADYRASYDLLRPVLDALASSFFDAGRDLARPFRDFLRDNPQARAYARFRAVCEHRAAPFDRWPARLRKGTLRPGDCDAGAERTHLYAQFELRRQLAELSGELAEREGGLYLDLAVGASANGYDTWANPGLFMPGASVGSPPDSTYTGGQDWGFPPMHPERAREEGYRYYIDSLRAQMRTAAFLRLDHVMALHRLYVVPQALDATQGVYVGYREEELFAILSLESHRNHCRVFGENLGTVPKQIETAMTRHKVGKMWVGQNALRDDSKRAVGPVDANCVASLNTHDQPPLATFLSGEDIPVRLDLGVFTPEMAPADRRWRKTVRPPLTAFLHAHGYTSSKRPRVPELARGFNAYVASSQGELALVNIEDLWGETRMQNVPGTSTEHPNWQHKLAHTLDDIEHDASLARTIEDLAERRAADPARITLPKNTAAKKTKSKKSASKKPAKRAAKKAGSKKKSPAKKRPRR